VAPAIQRPPPAPHGTVGIDHHQGGQSNESIRLQQEVRFDLCFFLLKMISLH